MSPLASAFEPAQIEDKWYKFWEEKGYFHAEEKSDKPPYCIVIPPPNVTGALHMGHALTLTIQDLLIRYKRMCGYNTLWLPGTDHAGIATQMVVERQLAKEGTNRHEIGREKFVERVWEWKKKYGNRIKEQQKRLGASVDWERERFTMDEGLSRAVREVFVKLYEEGLIFRDTRLINWCTSCQSALSDLEVDREEPEKGELWSFAYQLVDGSGEIVVATTRPETIFGDTAVCVHPDDERYKAMIGKLVQHPFLKRQIPIIADPELADMELGTGAVKVTPAHDPNDFACGKRNNLEFINILNPDGTLNEECGDFAGLTTVKARQRVKDELEARGLARGSKEHIYAPGRCQRHPKTVVEPMISTQWFVNTESLAREALKAVEEGKTEIIPAEWVKTYYHWLENIQPWCISRQLWWGHRIPAWYCDDCHKETVAVEAPTACKHCGSHNLHQDEDVLDTWFSSALWPFSTLGWPENTQLLKTFYPTSVLETGYDILFFWVARMMMMGIHFMGDVPFKQVLLHAMVRDERGKKMSKATGNVIDPLDVIDGSDLDNLYHKLEGYNLPPAELKRAKAAQEQLFPEGIPACGADAMRFTLAAYTAQTKDIHLSIKRIEGYRKFGNKIWQLTRFLLNTLGENYTPVTSAPEPKTLPAKWILSRLSNMLKVVAAGMDEVKISEVTMAIYQFIWNELCDWYVETIKPVIQAGEAADPEAFKNAQDTLYYVVETALRTLHPIMPFITEELWQNIPRRADMPESIMISPYPVAAEHLIDSAAEEQFGALMQIVTAIRAVRSDYTISPKVRLSAKVRLSKANLAAALNEQVSSIMRLSNADVTFVDELHHESGNLAIVVNCGEISVSLAGLINVEAEKAKVDKELTKLEKDIARFNGKLSNPSFKDRAPAEVVAAEETKLAEALEMKKGLEASLKRLNELA